MDFASDAAEEAYEEPKATARGSRDVALVAKTRRVSSPELITSRAGALFRVGQYVFGLLFLALCVLFFVGVAGGPVVDFGLVNLVLAGVLWQVFASKAHRRPVVEGLEWFFGLLWMLTGILFLIGLAGGPIEVGGGIVLIPFALWLTCSWLAGRRRRQSHGTSPGIFNKIRTGIGSGITSTGAILYLLAGLAALSVNLAVVMKATGWGFFAVVLAITFFPVTIIAAPWYALIAWGNPIPLAIGYGGFIVAAILIGLGGLILGDR